MNKVSFGMIKSPSKEQMAVAIIEALLADAGGKSTAEIRLSKNDFEAFKNAFYPDFQETQTSLLPRPTMILSAIIYEE